MTATSTQHGYDQECHHKKGSDMGTPRDTLAFVEGREVLDPTSLSYRDWEVIIDSTLGVIEPKYLHGFCPAYKIVGVLTGGERFSQHSGHPYRIWLGEPGDSPEFCWEHQYLICGKRKNSASGADIKTITQEFLLLGRDSKFYVLTTTWVLREGVYVFSDSPRDNHLKVRQANTLGVVEWCHDNQTAAPYLLRLVLTQILEAVAETENDLAGRLAHIREQREAAEQRVTAISWVTPGMRVWIALPRADDGSLTADANTYRVVTVANGIATFDRSGMTRPLSECYRSLADCEKAIELARRNRAP